MGGDPARCSHGTAPAEERAPAEGDSDADEEARRAGRHRSGTA